MELHHSSSLMAIDFVRLDYKDYFVVMNRILIPNAYNDSGCTPRKRKCLVLILLLISGNVHPNPGPIINSLGTPEDFKSRTGLGFIHLNVCSLLPKMDLVRAWAIQTDADVQVISETWLKKNYLR